MNRGLSLFGLLLGLSIACQAGCGNTQDAPVEVPPLDQTELLEVGEMYRIYIDDYKKPARAGKDLMKYAPAFSFGSEAIQHQTVIVHWGVPLEPGSETILAYRKSVPESGGQVLLQDGLTVKPMTAEEFAAAPKAGPTKSAPTKTSRTDDRRRTRPAPG